MALTLGLRYGTTEPRAVVLGKHRDVIKKLREGQSVRNAAKLTRKGVSTVQTVEAAL